MSTDTDLESAAQRVYEHWQFGTWEQGIKPAWVEDGNSHMQETARDFARAALEEETPMRPVTILERLENFGAVLFWLLVVYALFWGVISFADMELFNPLDSKPARFMLGICVLVAFVCAALISETEDEEQDKP